ncbi:MAG: serine hydrolase [Imperialibacter sp.]|uniref:serine hydrolase domain-containing protein n=1 Tax=Imperialibacter sp. TaxID=2038411 RepID=UPI0032EE143D
MIKQFNMRALYGAYLFFLFLAACEKPVEEKIIDLQRGVPEAEGVPSSSIQAFLESADTSKHEFHSFMFLRHGKVIAESWWSPYGPELPHTMYSTSKSFTSTAIGFAVTEKLLTVNDSVISFFPEYVTDSVSDFMAALTVKDLLTMSVGQDPDPSATIPGDSLWVKSFLYTPIINKPGTKFLYNSMATYMLSAIVTKVTGQKVIDYLKPRLFDPLHIQGIDWETDLVGNNTGGWGLRLKTEDMAKFGQLLLQKGKWNGEQILSEEWIAEATSFKIQQSPELPAETKAKSDWLQGYCYQFWRCRNNAFRGDGAFGQYIIVMPDQDAVIAITSETSDMQGILNMVWDQLLPAMSDDELPVDAAAVASLERKVASLALTIPSASLASTLEGAISEKVFELDSNGRNIESIQFQFGATGSNVVMKYKDTSYAIPIGWGEWKFSQTQRPGPYLVARAKNALKGLPPFKVAAAYSWTEENVLELTLRYIESPHTETIICTFEGEDVMLDFKWSFAPTMKAPVIEGELVEAQ